MFRYLFCACLLAASVPAFAQDTATVDAAAELRVVQPSVTVQALTSLDFGTVSIPNGNVAGNECVYLYQANNFRGRIEARELNSSGQVVANIFPTPSACDADENGNLAEISIVCDANRPIQYSLEYSDAGLAGLQFSEAQNIQLIFGATEPGMPLLTSGSLEISSTCPTDTATTLYVGGSLLVGETASEGAVTVGTIALTATY